MILPCIGPHVKIEKGDKVLMQRTPHNQYRITEFMDMKWATVRGFNNRGNIIIWFTKRDGDCSRWSKRRDIQREDIVAVERK